LSITCTVESITGITCLTGTYITVRYVVTGGQRTAAAIVRRTFINVWNNNHHRDAVSTRKTPIGLIEISLSNFVGKSQLSNLGHYWLRSERM